MSRNDGTPVLMAVSTITSVLSLSLSSAHFLRWLLAAHSSSTAWHGAQEAWRRSRRLGHLPGDYPAYTGNHLLMIYTTSSESYSSGVKWGVSQVPKCHVMPLAVRISSSKADSSDEAFKTLETRSNQTSLGGAWCEPPHLGCPTFH